MVRSEKNMESICIWEKILLMNQEQQGDYDFSGEIMYSSGFSKRFGIHAPHIAVAAVEKIKNTYINPDYLQVCFYEDVKFWVISNSVRKGEQRNINHISVILPEEY